MSRLNVVIPVMRWDLASLLLMQMSSNTKPPDKVLIIDNSGDKSYNMPDYRFVLNVIRPGKNLGVNASWNLGLELFRHSGHLCILNDDIQIFPRFFEKVREGFELEPEAGAICPKTVTVWEAFIDNPDSINLYPMKKREGWAFTLRDSVVKEMPPIPDRLEVFCGDDWFWKNTHYRGYKWFGDISNVLYHMVGASLKTHTSLRAKLKREKRAFSEITKELGI